MENTFDSIFCDLDSTIIHKGIYHGSIIILKDRNEYANSSQINWYSFLVPIIITIIGAVISYLLNRSKTYAEINKLNLDSEKINEELKNSRLLRDKMINERDKLSSEVEKMRIETEFLKNSFQPHILSILKDTQKVILNEKLDGLKQLVTLSRSYFSFEKRYIDGEEESLDEHEYYQNFYNKFGKFGYNEFQKFIADYEYLYPVSVIEHFQPIRKDIQKLYDSNKRSNSLQELWMTNEDFDILKELPDKFQNAINAVRKDLHLDNSFVHQFLETYNISK